MKRCDAARLTVGDRVTYMRSFFDQSPIVGRIVGDTHGHRVMVQPYDCATGLFEHVWIDQIINKLKAEDVPANQTN